MVTIAIYFLREKVKKKYATMLMNRNWDNEDVMIQSHSAPTQYKNRHASALLKRLANEFNLRIIRTYGAAGHGKGTIDVMSSFEVKNVLRRNIVIQEIFFDTSEEIVDYLHIKSP